MRFRASADFAEGGGGVRTTDAALDDITFGSSAPRIFVDADAAGTPDGLS